MCRSCLLWLVLVIVDDLVGLLLDGSGDIVESAFLPVRWSLGVFLSLLLAGLVGVFSRVSGVGWYDLL